MKNLKLKDIIHILPIDPDNYRYVEHFKFIVLNDTGDISHIITYDINILTVYNLEEFWCDNTLYNKLLNANVAQIVDGFYNDYIDEQSMCLLLYYDK